MRISKEAIIISGIGVVFVIVMGFLIWKSSSTTSPSTVSTDKQDVLVRSTSHMTGTTTAKVTMVEFGDYQCPACGYAYPALKQITNMYEKNPNFNFVFRNFPLPQHQYAQMAAEAAEAAGAEDKYWQMHDMLYEGQVEWTDAKDPLSVFVGYAQKIGLDAAKFKQAVNKKDFQSVINADLDDANKLKLDHTPTIIINGVEQTDLSVVAMKAKIDSLLAQ